MSAYFVEKLNFRRICILRVIKVSGQDLAICYNCLDVHPVRARRWWKDKHGNLTLLKGCPKCERTTILAIVREKELDKPMDTR